MTGLVPATLFALVALLPATALATTIVPERQLEDVDITFAVERELRSAGGVEADPIDVETTLGVVTLSGRADNLLASERAEQVASIVKGVRAVVNRIEVRPEARTDDAIRQDVRAALTRGRATDSWEIDVEVEQGTATLTGDVDSWWEKRLAEKIAAGVRGLAAVDNRLEVRQTKLRPDFEIADDVRSVLAWDLRINDNLIDVEVADGHVRLSGAVSSAFEKTLSETKAHVAGVASVDASALEVEWWSRDHMIRSPAREPKSDERIEAAVRDALRLDPRITSQAVEVDVNNGTATLSGTVKRLGAKHAAIRDAANTTGVWRVKDYLKVRPLERDDADIADDVRTALLADPYVNYFDVDVHVRSGVVSLTGLVESRFEKRQIERLAAEVRGVTSIRNLLGVSRDEAEVSVQEEWWETPLTDSYALEPPVLAPPSDREILLDIEQEMFWSPFVDSREIEVTVSDGVAHLSGTVNSRFERREAEKEAYQGGAIEVDNDLELRARPPVPAAL